MTQEGLELKKDSYTIGKNETSDVDVLTYAFEEGRYNQLIKGSLKILGLFKDIQQHLPPFRMTISPHDSPNRLSDYGVKSAALEAAASKACELFHLVRMKMTYFEQISNRPYCQKQVTWAGYLLAPRIRSPVENRSTWTVHRLLLQQRHLYGTTLVAWTLVIIQITSTTTDNFYHTTWVLRHSLT